MNFYLLLEQAILSDDIGIKAQLTAQCLAYCSQNEISSEEGFVPKVFESPSYASKCTIVSPKDLRMRKDFDTLEGLASLVHSIAHIEYSAIDLALDGVYRYRDMPQEYNVDWLSVASDEIRHFGMLKALLVDLGFDYGDFSVHSGLFDAGKKTLYNSLHRMAIVPRYFEASGLDVGPQIVKKLHNKRKLVSVARLIEVLEIIYVEEIDHVLKGDKWFKFLCQASQQDESVYFEILEQYGLLQKHRPHVNVQGRKEAGFSSVEIKRLSAKVCK